MLRKRPFILTQNWRKNTSITQTICGRVDHKLTFILPNNAPTIPSHCRHIVSNCEDTTHKHHLTVRKIPSPNTKLLTKPIAKTTQVTWHPHKPDLRHLYKDSPCHNTSDTQPNSQKLCLTPQTPIKKSELIVQKLFVCNLSYTTKPHHITIASNTPMNSTLKP